MNTILCTNYDFAYLEDTTISMEELQTFVYTVDLYITQQEEQRRQQEDREDEARLNAAKQAASQRAARG